MRSLGKALIALALAVQPLTLAGQDDGSRATDWSLPVERCWDLAVADISTTEIASDNVSQFFFFRTRNQVESRTSHTGSLLLWRTPVSGVPVTPISFSHDEQLVFVTRAGEGAAQLISVHAESGIASLLQPGILPKDASVLLTNGKQTFVVSGADVLLIEGNGQRRMGRLTNEEEVTSSAFSSGLLLLGTNIGSVRVFDLESADGGTSFSVGKGRISIAAAKGGVFYVGDAFGNVYSVAIDGNGVNWSSRTGGEPVAIEFYRGDPIVASSDNFIYRLANGNGRRIWKRKLPGRPLGFHISRQRFAAAATVGGREVQILDLKDGKLVNRILLGEETYSISPPHFVGDILLVPYDRGIAAYSSSEGCENSKGRSE